MLSTWHRAGLEISRPVECPVGQWKSPFHRSVRPVSFPRRVQRFLTCVSGDTAVSTLRRAMPRHQCHSCDAVCRDNRTAKRSILKKIGLTRPRHVEGEGVITVSFGCLGVFRSAVSHVKTLTFLIPRFGGPLEIKGGQ